MNRIFLGILLSITSISSYAGCESVFESNVGWAIVDSKTIDGYRKENGEKEDSFEGCEHGRVIYFRDGTSATCNSYGYQYAYAPTAIILGKSVNYQGKSFTMLKMIVECDEYDLQ
ncbi:MAG: hypothetical protein K9L32_05795 [Chromatiaceae bacterium]|nr:hypothetical protein [Chromatiaceae bacterium]MCF8003709.1 hypothetical protein [Chromatiaceae bacterium]